MRKRLQSWLAETHSSNFELCRHFFRRFFDSELVSEPGQAKVVAGGALAILISLSLIYTQAYYHKYLELAKLDDPEPFRRAELADVLFVITLAMAAIGLFTALEWPALFPGLRDYLALAGLPMRMRDIFVAKFTALLGFVLLASLAIAFLPSLILPAVLSNGYEPETHRQILAIFVSMSLAAMFVFFSLVAVQGLLLNVLPVRAFPRVSLAVQALLLGAFLCTLPFVFSIPNLQASMNLRPDWAIWIPPLWFLGLDQAMAANHESLALRLARAALLGPAFAAAAALLTYFWSYRRHRTRVIESPSIEQAAIRTWPAAVAERLFPNLRALAVFDFIGKSLARSRQHRLILTAFGAIALALIVEGFVSLALGGGGFSPQSRGFRQAVISVPLAFSLFTLTGYRYLFRLPVELRANWIFRIHEPGNAVDLLSGVEGFLLVCGVLPVALFALPVEIGLMGVGPGLLASALCLPPSLILTELLLFGLEKIPFTSSYFPGQRPLIDVVLGYLIAAALYVGVFSTLVRWALASASGSIVLILFLLGGWWKARKARLDSRQIERLGFEDQPEPAVQLLGIERD